MEFLLPPRNTHTFAFYVFPKIYKSNCPLHPIVWRSDGPTDHLLCYIKHFIQPLANNLPSHIKDTKHFMYLFEQPPPLPTNSLLVTTDVTSLYTNDLHDDSIAAVIYFMEACKHLIPSNCPPLPKLFRQSLISFLKVVSTTFLLVYFLCLKNSTSETRKNIFYFTSKALFAPEIIRF